MPVALTIECLAVDCHVPQPIADDTRRANDVLDRILSSATQEVAEYLRRAFASEPASNTIAFIDTLHFDATINAAWPRDEIARAVATQLLRSLWRRLDDPDTIRFKDRAEMLAQFILDLAQGAGYTRGWHRCFDGLRLLSTSGIIRTLIVDEPLVAGAALARLLPADLQKVTALLAEPDAERALATILGAAPDSDADPVAVATAIVAQRCFPLRKPQQQLAFAIAMLRETGAACDAALALSLMQLAAEPSAAASIDSEALKPDSVAEAVRILSREVPGDQASEQSSTCGGIWLILPHVLAILGDERTLVPVALCALALAAGDDAPTVWRDDLLRVSLGLDDAVLSTIQERAGPISAFAAERPLRQVAREGVTELHPPPPYSHRRRNLAHLRRGIMQLNLPYTLTRAATRVAYGALSAYAWRLPGFAESSFAHLWRNFLATEAMLRVHARAIEVTLTPPPLDVIWRISGADRAVYVLPDGRGIRVGVRR